MFVAAAGLQGIAPMDFDRDYYRRFYFDPQTAVISRREMAARARLIAAKAEHTGLPVGHILEAGCGTACCVRR